MRAFRPFVLVSVGAASSVAACLAPEEQTANQGDAVTGGKSEDNSPLVFLNSRTEVGRSGCVGTMLSERFAVTTRACASKDLLVKRASEDKDRTSAIKELY